MANFTGSFDLHTEKHENVADNDFTAAATAAAAGIFCCPKHSGIWISRPKRTMLFLKSMEVRDCPACVADLTKSPVKETSPPTNYIPVEKSPRPTVGVLRDTNGVYEGEIMNGKRNGKGKQTFADGEVYEGDFKDDKMNGKGKFTCTDGEVFEGDFKDDERNGKGKSTFASGDVYEGSWKDGEITGKGKFTFANGEVHE